MAVDLLEKSRVNIKDVVLPEPKQGVSGLPFNPEREITSKDQVEIEKDLRKLMETPISLGATLPYFDDLVGFYLATKTLFPQITERLPISKALQSGINKRLEIERSDYRKNLVGMSFDHYIDLCADLRLAFPQRKIPNLIADKKDQAQLYSQVSDALANHLIDRAFSRMRAYKILYPHFFPFSEALEAWAQSILLDKYFDNLRETGEWHSFVKKAAALKVTAPEYSHSIHIKGTDWDAMRTNLLDHERKSGGWGFFTVYALNLTILAAEKVSITENGLEITLPKSEDKLDTGKHDLPAVRKF